MSRDQEREALADPAGSGVRIEYARHKRTHIQRFLRLIGAIIDPRAWVHLLKLVNYYNYANVQPRRVMTIGAGTRISPTATFAYGHRIRLGERFLVGENTRLWAGPEHVRIIVGEDTIIGPNVTFGSAAERLFSPVCMSETVL